jgi:hypothetical protein
VLLATQLVEQRFGYQHDRRPAETAARAAAFAAAYRDLLARDVTDLSPLVG